VGVCRQPSVVEASGERLAVPQGLKPRCSMRGFRRAKALRHRWESVVGRQSSVVDDLLEHKADATQTQEGAMPQAGQCRRNSKYKRNSRGNSSGKNREAEMKQNDDSYDR
jgi:hypothetical protein